MHSAQIGFTKYSNKNQFQGISKLLKINETVLNKHLKLQMILKMVVVNSPRGGSRSGLWETIIVFFI